MLIVVLIVASLSLLCGFLVGLIIWSFASLPLALGIGTITSILAFFGLFYLAIRIASERSPEDAVEEMSDWLASPLECGEQPESCEVVFDDEVEWPRDGTKQRVFLCRYAFPEESENDAGIGFVGPMTFSFLDLDWDAFTHEQLIQCYRGMHLAMLLQTEDGDQEDFTEEERNRLSAHLTSTGYAVTDRDLLLNAQIVRPPESEALFAVQIEKESEKVIVVGDLGALDLLETRRTEVFSVPLAHYHWLDSWWFAKQDDWRS